jgi:hypothetical protein
MSKQIRYIFCLLAEVCNLRVKLYPCEFVRHLEFAKKFFFVFVRDLNLKRCQRRGRSHNIRVHFWERFSSEKTFEFEEDKNPSGVRISNGRGILFVGTDLSCWKGRPTYSVSRICCLFTHQKPLSFFWRAPLPAIKKTIISH